MAAIGEFLADRGKLRTALKGLGTYGDELEKLALRGKAAAKLFEKTPAEHLREMFSALVIRIELGEQHMSIEFRSIELRRFLLWDAKTPFRGRTADWPCSDARYVLNVDVNPLSASRWPLLHIHPKDGSRASKPNKALLRLLGNARKAQQLVDDRRDLGIEELATAFGCRPGHFSRLVRLNYLAPDIVTAILDGTQPATLTKDVLLKANLPTDWAVQRRLLGFDAPYRPMAPRQLYGRGMWPSAMPTEP